jgi:hypothetical protein
MRLKALAISFILFFYPFNLLADSQYKLAEDDLGSIDRVIEIDGEFYFIFNHRQALGLLSDIQAAKLSREQIDIYKYQIDLYRSVVKEKDFLINLINSDRESDKELINKLSQPKPWYLNDSFIFISGFLVSSALFGFWTYMDRKGD